MLHAIIYENFLTSANSNKKQVLVLVTGDGNGNFGQTSFRNSVELLLKGNWNVELWAWKLSMSQNFSNIQQLFPNQMTIKYLDDYRAEITFTESYKKTEDRK